MLCGRGMARSSSALVSSGTGLKCSVVMFDLLQALASLEFAVRVSCVFLMKLAGCDSPALHRAVERSANSFFAFAAQLEESVNHGAGAKSKWGLTPILPQPSNFDFASGLLTRADRCSGAQARDRARPAWPASSGLRPSAFDSRKAMSGVTRLLPLSTRLKVDAATSRRLANSRPLTP